MAIESFLKAEKGDPDWFYSPSHYIGKQFKVIDANCLQIQAGTEDVMVLRLSPDENDLLCKNLQVIARENSKLNLYIICDGEEQLQQVFLYNIKVLYGAILNVGVFLKNGRLNKHIFEVEVDEMGVFNIYGINKNETGGSSEIITKVYHGQPGAESQQMIHCIAGEGSRTVYQGNVQVEAGMVDNFVNVSNSSLITGEGGQAFSIPQFLIECGDIEAQHSCNVGHFDADALWYLQSRGLSKKDAENVLIDAHQNCILDFIPNQELKDELKEFFHD